MDNDRIALAHAQALLTSTAPGVIAPGSYLVLSHPILELGGEGNRAAMEFWNEHARPPIRARSAAELRRLLSGVELVAPGLVSCSRWRPDPFGTTGREVPQYAAVGIKR